MKIAKAITAAEAVRRVQADRFVLPGIQRNFVWETKQICSLFDSLMRDYPIGSLIVWRTRPADHKDLPFRRIVTNSLGRETELNTARPPAGDLIDAVLDGQQRLTALNIGLRGSYRSSGGGAERYLYLNLDEVEDDAGPDGVRYKFEFRSPTNVARSDVGWFKVIDSFGLRRDGLRRALSASEIEFSRQRLAVLNKLVDTINRKSVLPSAVENASDLDRVLNIFARVNQGGTQLTYAELLLSTATAKWKHRDALSSFEDLRRKLNATGEGFRVPNDRIVKAGLVLLDAEDPKFHVENFFQAGRAQQLEKQWPAFETAMRAALAILDSFGLSGQTIAGQNVIIPVAYYAWNRKLRPSYATAVRYESDRRLVRAFVARTLLQRAYWTGAVDPVLVATRKAIKEHRRSGFPLQAIEKSLEGVKSITVNDSLIEELVELPYSDRRTLALLRMLFPSLPTKQRLDKDHVFPSPKFKSNQLSTAGLPASDLDRLCRIADALPNLQLLGETDNIHKKHRLPAEWLRSLKASDRTPYTRQGVKYLPEDLSGFEKFWNTRRAFLERRIRALLTGAVLR